MPRHDVGDGDGEFAAQLLAQMQAFYQGDPTLAGTKGYPGKSRRAYEWMARETAQGARTVRIIESRERDSREEFGATRRALQRARDAAIDAAQARTVRGGSRTKAIGRAKAEYRAAVASAAGRLGNRVRTYRREVIESRAYHTLRIHVRLIRPAAVVGGSVETLELLTTDVPLSPHDPLGVLFGDRSRGTIWQMFRDTLKEIADAYAQNTGQTWVIDVLELF